jgi:methyl-accepting chemotaxis protein
MFKHMKLGAKLIGGFSIVCLLTLALGIFAVVNMLSVKRTATELSVELVPEVGVANEVERWSLQTMYATRGYAFTEEPEFLQQARANLEKTKGFLKAATEHADKYDLPTLRANAKKATEKAALYEQALNETVKVTEAMEKEKATMNTSAAEFVSSCEAFVHAQEKKLDEELGQLAAGKTTADKVKERASKVEFGYDIINQGGTVRIGAWKAIAEREPVQFNKALQAFPGIFKSLDTLKPITRLPADMKELDDIRKSAANYQGAMERFLTNWQAREDLGKKRNVAAGEVLAAAEETAKYGMAVTSKATDAAASSLASSSTLLIIGVATCVVLGLLLGFFITRSITKPIMTVATTLSSGADQSAAAAGQVSSSSQSLAEGSSEQAASLEETSSSLEEMSSMTKRNAGNAQRANDLAREASASATAGATDMQAMAVAMADIKTSSDDIAKIIKTIDEIAFQTNILALNAAVEAARAGEAGMGFAVVADEVRNLAQRSAVAAKETATKIEGAIGRTALGVNLSEKVAARLQEIVTKAKQVDELVAEVATASKEQTQGIDQLNTAIGQIDKVTQSNAANAEESASAAEEMSAQTEALKEAVGDLLALVNGSTARTATPAAGLGAHEGHGAGQGQRRPKARAAARANGGASLVNGNGNGEMFAGARSDHVVLTPPNRTAPPAFDSFKDMNH